MVRAVPDLPDAPRRTGRPAPRADGARPAASLHARRPGRDGRRLPGGATRRGALDPAPDRRGTAGHRAVADPAGRVPGFGRDHHPEPRVRLGAGRGARPGDADRLPAGHVRAYRPDAADPAEGRDRAGRRLARRPRGDRPQQVRLVGARRLRGGDRVPGRRLRQRRLSVRRPGSLRLQAGRLPDRQRPVLWRALVPRHVRDGPCGPLPPPGRCRRRGQCDRQRGRGRGSRHWPTTPPGPRSMAGPSRTGPESCAPARGRTC